MASTHGLATDAGGAAGAGACAGTGAGVGTGAAGVSAGTPSIAVGSYATPPPTESEADEADEAEETEEAEEVEEATEADGPAPTALTGSDASSAGADELPLSCDTFGRCGRPTLSAASCNHSGGVSRKDVWFRSIRAAGTAACAGTSSAAPYSSSYRRITSPTGSPGHSVASPLSRAITSR